MNHFIKAKFLFFISLFVLFIGALEGQSSPDITIEPTRPTDRCSNGALNLILDGGVGPYSVDWYWLLGGGAFLIEGNDDLPGNNGTEDLEDLPAGTYQVNITDAACGQATVRIELQQGLFSDGADRIITKKTNVSDCSERPLDDGEIEIIDIIGLSQNYTISWSGPGVNGNTSPIISNLGPGDYTVTISSPEGCRLKKTITICCCGSGEKSEGVKSKCGNQEITFPITIYQDLLFSPDDENSYNGEIKINVEGGTPDNEIIWTGPNGFTSSRLHIRNLGVGTYCVNITDGCSKDSRCFELISCASRNITINGIPENTCTGLAFGSINASVQGGDPPYQYNWSNGSNSSTVNNLFSGAYNLTVSDRNGCTATASYSINDNIEIRETRNGCVFIYDCSGNIVRTNDIGSFTEVRPSDCRIEDTRCSDGVLVQTRTVGTGFDSYSSSNCTVREFCILTNQTFNNHNGNSRVQAIEGHDTNNSCWWCHDVSFCEFPSLNGATVINNVVSNISISFVPGDNCATDGHQLHRVFCRNQLIWEGCSDDETVCNSNLLGVKMEEETNTTQLHDGRIEVRKTYKVVDFDSQLIFDNLKERGLLSKNARLLDIKEPNESVSLVEHSLDDSPVDFSDVQEVKLRLYPNPFDDQITFKISNISLETSVNLSIFDTFGNIVYTEKYYNSNLSEITKTVRLVDLPSGVYFFNLSLSSTSFTKKITKL